MMIRNFYIVLWYLFWSYLMLCLCIKLFMDRIKRIRRAGRLAYIHRSFSAGSLDGKRVRRRLERYAKDDILFFHICEYCLAGRKESGGLCADRYEQLLRRLVNQKKAQTAAGDELLRQLIAMYERKAGEEEPICAAS